MADVIDYRIHGHEMQLVEVLLDRGEGVRAEAGAMAYMSDGVEMQTGAGGLFSGFKRMLTGESFFITTFVHAGDGQGRIGFAAPYPGSVVALDLSEHGGTVLCQKDAFLCAAAGIDISVAFTKRLGSGLFGGEGFVLQKLSGDGLAFVHAGGTVLREELAAGQTLRLDTGCLVAMTAAVDYDVRFVGGFKNALFGGEGLFLATVQGPGTVWMQSLPFSRLSDRIAAAVRAQIGSGDRG